MKYEVKTIKTINKRTYSGSKIFKSEKDAIDYADENIDNYGIEFEGDVIERSPYYYVMEAEGVKIEIRIKEIE